MQVHTYLDVDVVAVEQTDQVTVMLELVAPVQATKTPRPPAAVQVALDRSGSMNGERLEAAKAALLRLVDRLDPSDRFGVVAFDDEVQVVVPAGEIKDKVSVRQAIANLHSGGMTNLSGGLLRGLQEARRVAADSGSTLLLSDGHANAGETDAQQLAAIAASAHDRGTTTSSIGIGLGYDEQLLAELARGGQGNHAFAEQGEDAAAAVAGEVEGLLSKTIQAASLTIRPFAEVDTVTAWNDLPVTSSDDEIVMELGDLWAGEERKLVLGFAVPAMPGLGLTQVAQLELRYVAVPTFVEQTVTIPVHVNVVPGDLARNRIRDQKVRTELVYQQVQDAKRRASQALRDGDVEAAMGSYDAAGAELDELIAEAPSDELRHERDILSQLRKRTGRGEVDWAAKYARMDQSRKSRKRGRD